MRFGEALEPAKDSQRLLRELYPNLNIQVYYQKDFENLIFKYGLAERPVEA